MTLSRSAFSPEIILPVTLSAAVLIVAVLSTFRPSSRPSSSSSAGQTSTAAKNAILPPSHTHHPRLLKEEVAKLPYGPNIFPGGRDVDTPYGIMRVFEWGPLTAKRHVLLISGDTTPCPMLGNIAWGLVHKGCRVMTFDLWGRGLSSTPMKPSTAGVKRRLEPQTIELFTQQIYFALTSSPISWTGMNPATGSSTPSFSIIGFSLGGAIAMCFASHFPRCVSSIVLLAPAGILPSIPKDYTDLKQADRWVGVDNLPLWWKRRKVGQTIGVDLDGKGRVPAGKDELDSAVPAKVASDFEVSGTARARQFGKDAENFSIDVVGAVQYQFDHHCGFIDSFISTIGNGGIQNRHEEWKGVIQNIVRKSEPAEIVEADTSLPNHRRGSKLLLIFASDDDVVSRADIEADVRKMFENEGIKNKEIDEFLDVKEVEGGHGFPVPRWREVLIEVCEFWAL